MIIKNITKNRTFAQDYKLCNTFFSKAKGLMFSRKKNFRNLIFVFDGMVSYKNKKIKKDEFIKLNPQLKDNDFSENLIFDGGSRF